MRDDQFLRSKLKDICYRHFPEITTNNSITIKFGRKAKKRLGSIRECLHRRRTNESLILINGHFKDKNIPEFIVDATIAHELCHYVQGFGSGLPQLSRFPHRGGVVDSELEKRGLDELATTGKAWMDQNWLAYLRKENA